MIQRKKRKKDRDLPLCATSSRGLFIYTYNLGSVHMYPDIVESANFSLQIQKNRVHAYPDISMPSSTGQPTNVILWYSLAPYFTRKRLAPISLLQRIRPSPRRRTRSVLKKKIHSGECIQKVADSLPNSSDTCGRKLYPQRTLKLRIKKYPDTCTL